MFAFYVISSEGCLTAEEIAIFERIKAGIVRRPRTRESEVDSWLQAVQSRDDVDALADELGKALPKRDFAIDLWFARNPSNVVHRFHIPEKRN